MSCAPVFHAYVAHLDDLLIIQSFATALGHLRKKIVNPIKKAKKAENDRITKLENDIGEIKSLLLQILHK